jgi:hypothetical protein
MLLLPLCLGHAHAEDRHTIAQQPAQERPGDPAPAAAWSDFTAPDHSFRISTPIAATQKQDGPKTFLWGASPPGASYLFGYTPVPGFATSTAAEQKEALLAFTDALLKSANIKESGRKEVAGGPGMEVDVTGIIMDMPVQAHMFCSSKAERIYVLMAIGETEPEHFFSSFATSP